MLRMSNGMLNLYYVVMDIRALIMSLWFNKCIGGIL